MKNQFHYIFVRSYLVHVNENEFFFFPFTYLYFNRNKKIKENDFLMFGFIIENIKGNQYNQNFLKFYLF